MILWRPRFGIGGGFGAVAVGLMLALTVVAGGCGDEDDSPQGGQTAGTASFGERTLSMDLYFPGPGGSLHPRTREIAVPDDPEQQIRAVLAALLEGPGEDGDLEPVFPAAASPIEIAEVYLSPDGVAILDFRPVEGDWRPMAGSREELLMVYSLVNTVSLNVPAARRVSLLWNGLQRSTFAGHVDTTRPLAPAPDLVVR